MATYRMPTGGILPQDTHDSISPHWNISHRTVHRGVTANLTQHWQIAGHDRSSTGHRLDYRETESLCLRRHQHDCRPPVDGGQHVALDKGQLDYPALEMKLAGQLFLLGCKSAADATEAGRRKFVRQSCERIQQYVDSFPRDRAADVQNFQAPRLRLAQQLVALRG